VSWNDLKVMVWYAVSAQRIIGPMLYFFYETDPFFDQLTDEEKS
jgi:hypothetical protein